VLFRKKPAVIEAMQWDGSAEGATPIINWILSSSARSARYHEHLMDGDFVAHPDPYLTIDTPEGTMSATSGDWIIRGVLPEFYPCKPDFFAATYEQYVKPGMTFIEKD
jgi:hypothetical protein